MEKNLYLKEEKLWSAFKYFSETNKSNFITSQSVINALRMQSIIIDENGINDFFKTLSDSGNKLDFEDFKKIVKL